MPPEPAETGLLRLRVLMPTRTVLERDVAKVVAEAVDGSFCLLPRHVDFVTALVPGILAHARRDGTEEEYVAVNGGVLVKVGPDVSVATAEAVPGDALERLRERVEREFLALDEQQRTARSVLARLEAGVLRRFVDMQGS